MSAAKERRPKVRAMELEDVEARVTAIEEVMTKAIEALADEVRRKVIVPICRKHRMTFMSGNGSYSFYSLNRKRHDFGDDVLNKDDAQDRGEPFVRAFALLDTPVPNHHMLGMYVADVSKEDLSAPPSPPTTNDDGTPTRIHPTQIKFCGEMVQTCSDQCAYLYDERCPDRSHIKDE